MRLLEREEYLSDWVPWLDWLDHRRDAVTTVTGGLLCAAVLHTPDLETASPEALDGYHARAGEAFARLGTGWSAWVDQWRTAAPGYLPGSAFGGNPGARAIDDSRRRQFTDAARPVFATTTVLALHYMPRAREAAMAILTERDDTLAASAIGHFRETTDALLMELAHAMRGVSRLAGDQLASLLHASTTYRPRHVSAPGGQIAPQLVEHEWVTWPAVEIDGLHLATVEVHGFGSPHALTCEGLHELPFEARWVTTFHGLDPDDRRKEVGEVRKRWATKQRGFGAIITEIVTKNPYAGRTDPEADRAIAQMDVLQGELADRPFALASCNVHVWADTRALADERAARVAAYLRSRGLVARPAWLNNVLAPLGDMPGNVTQETMRAGLLRGRGPAMNVRRTRVEMGAITRVSPLTGISQGHEADWRFGGPALLMATTRRGMRFSWAMNAPGSDSAHTAVVGKTGSGKSVLLALMAAQFLRYDGARVAVFDRGRSFMVPCLALGGDWIELGAGGKGVQPLRAVDRPEEMNWAHEWVMRALKVRGLTTTPQTEMAVGEALRLVAEAPEERRTLSLLHAYLGQNNDARGTLAHYLAGQGPYGELFDGVVASYGDAPVIGVETRDITQLEDAAPLAVTAMFRAIQRDRLVGDSPKLVMVDEAWSLMGNEHFSDVIESWAREMRKLKTALVLATQSVHDLAGDRTKVIFDQIANRIYLPHAEAMRPQTRALYEAAGLTEEQVQLLSVARPKGEYLLQTEELTRLVDIRLEGEALAICGASTPADHARALALLGRGVQPGEAFLGEWLAQSTRDWLAAQGVALLRAAE